MLSTNKEITQELIAAYWTTKLRFPAYEAPALYYGPVAGERAVTALAIDPAVAEQVRAMANNNPLAEYVIYLSCWSVLLYKYFPQPHLRIAVGDVDPKGITQQTGSLFFFDGRFNGSLLLKEVLEQAGREVSEIITHRDINAADFTERITAAGININSSLVYGFAWHTADGVAERAQLTLEVGTNASGEMLLRLHYNTALNGLFAQQLLQHYSAVLQAFYPQRKQPLAAFSYVPLDEQAALLRNGEQAAPFAAAQCLQEQLSLIAQQYPQRVAIVQGSESITYGELEARANRLAHLLRRDYGVTPNMPVGLQGLRSPALLAGLWAILKAGGAYVPVDPAYPAARRQYLLTDSGMQVLLSDEAVADLPNGITRVALDAAEHLALPATAPDLINSASDLAYILYTSGTTGQPKGVRITHRNVQHLAAWLSATIYRQHDRPLTAMLTASLNFDASVQQLFAPLFNGGTLVLLKEEERRDPAAYIRSLIAHKVDVLDITPSYLQAVLQAAVAAGEQLPLLYTLVGGEALNSTLIRQYYQYTKGSTLLNVYGITECTVNSACYRCTGTETGMAPLGSPLSNTRIYILDQQQQPVPRGVTGELYIGGAGVGAGYHGGAATKQNSRFAADLLDANQHMYRTGDLGYLDMDNRLIYAGRNDEQVKIRGYRIEPAELEQTALQYPGVKGCTVQVYRDASGEASLVLYVVYNDTADEAGLRSYLRQQLPVWMEPAYIIPLSDIPLTAHGKVNRQALPDPVAALQQQVYEAPATALEAQLQQIWQEVLGISRVGVTDNFFELGGHSLKALRIFSAIHRRLQLNAVLTDIFSYPTIRTFAIRLENAAATGHNSIPVQEPLSFYPVSYAQQRIWLLDNMEKAAAAYNMPAGCYLTGSIQPLILEQAINALISRHEILRTGFIMQEDRLVQVIHAADTVHCKLNVISAQGKDDEQLAAMLTAAASTRFNLEKPLLFNATLVQLEQEKYVLLLNMHHIITDGWSAEILLQELLRLYEAFVQEQPSPLAPLRIQYRDYAVWQQQGEGAAIIAAQQQYWLQQFAGELPVLALQTDRPRPAVKTYNGRTYYFQLDQLLVQQLQTLSQEQGATLFMTLLACVQVLLHKYTAQHDLVIGTVTAGRDYKDLEDQAGMYANSLALRCRFNTEDTFTTLLAQTKALVLDAFAHQQYPFDKLVNELPLKRDTSRHPLFDVMVMLNGEQQATAPVAYYEPELPTSKFDITFNFTAVGNSLTTALEYNTDLFDAARIALLAKHFSTLLTNILAAPGAVIQSYRLMPLDEEAALLRNDEQAAPFAATQCLQEQLSLIAQQYPQRVAIVQGNESITYGELEARANRLAHLLRRDYGVTPNTPVGLQGLRSPALLAGLWAILKAGGAYVPVDPAYPAARRQYLLTDSGMQVLLSDEAAADLPNGITRVALDAAEHLALPATAPDLINSASDLAYILYTSGTTGQPKGVRITHRNVQHLAAWLSATIYRQHDRPLTAMLTASLNFDASVQQLFAPLFNGGTLVLLKEEERRDTAAYIRSLITHKVDVLDITPSYLQAVLQAAAAAGEQLPVLYTLVGGEALNSTLIRQYYQYTSGSTLLNVYGITECTVNSACYRCTGMETGMAPLGSPLSNTRIYILDQQQQPVPRGVTGELYIGGAGVGAGYHGSAAAKQNSRFVADLLDADQHMYRTGDLGYLDMNNRLVYAGRNDEQVKIRGYRIEPAELEQTALQYPGVQGCTVQVHRDANGEVSLVLYVVYNDTADEAGLRSYLRQQLPVWMEPGYIIPLSDIPLTAHGKVNRQALPDPVAALQQQVYEAPATALEAQLQQIWQEVLGISRVGVTDNFFELGGHSLKALRVITAIYKHLHIKTDLGIIFSKPDIRQLAASLAGSTQTVFEPIPPAPQQNSYPLSHAQQRLWILHQYEEGQAAYNMNGAWLLKGRLDVKKFKQAFLQLVARHESLRTTFIVREGIPQQVINPMQDIYGMAFISNADAAALIRQEENTPFDLEKGPLFRATLVQLDNQQHVFILSLHHIISDGWSDGILMNELQMLYTGGLQQTLPALAIQYKDYAVWHNRRIAEGYYSSSAQYWKQQFAVPVPALDLPLDHARKAVRTYEAATAEVKLDAALTETLQRYSRQSGGSLYITLLAALNALLYRYTRQTDLVIGSPVSGREHPDLEQQVGFYANTLPVRSQIAAGSSFRELVNTVKTNVMQVFQHQHYPFDEIIKHAVADKQENRAALFDVMLVLQDAVSRPQGDVGFEISEYHTEIRHTQFDLVFNITAHADQLHILLMYNRDLFEKDIIDSLLCSYTFLLEQLPEKDAVPLTALVLPVNAKNTQPAAPFIIMDDNLHPLPLGAAGTIYVQENMTGALLLKQKNTAVVDHGQAQYLDTGAAGRLTSCGQLVSLPPDDVVISINGSWMLRPWLENELLRAPVIRAAAITCVENSIVAHIVAAAGETTVTLYKTLLNFLPVAVLDEIKLNIVPVLPLTDSGNVNRVLLSSIPAFSRQQLAALENAVLETGLVDQAAAICSPEPEENGWLHIHDIQPAANRTAPLATAKKMPDVMVDEHTSQAPAILHGGVLQIAPDEPVTLPAALLQAAAKYAGNGITYLDANNSAVFQSYAALLQEAKQVLAGLQHKGLQPADQVILQLEDARKYFAAFWACILGGMIPVTVAVPPVYDTENAVVKKLAGVCTLLQLPVIITEQALQQSLQTVTAGWNVKEVICVEAIAANENDAQLHTPAGNATAFYQLSSGSTGTAKCITITHRGVADHVYGMRAFNGFSSSDISLNWIPFDHVAALLAYHIRDVFLGIRQVQLPAAVFLSRPLAWLDCIEKYGVTHAWSPNFGFKLVTDALRTAGRQQSRNLRSIRYLLNAGEQVTLPVIRAFLEQTAAFGLQAACIQPGYGMAETCTGITHQHAFDTEESVCYIKRGFSGRQVFTTADDQDAHQFISVGKPRPGSIVRITDEEDRVVACGVTGRIQIHANSVTPGYLHNDEENRALLTADGWYKTGDLGFVWQDELVVCGREKEMIIIRGVNHYCYAIEDVVNRVPGVVPTYSGACAVTDTAGGTEALLIGFCPASFDESTWPDTIQAIQAAVSADLGIAPQYVIPVSRNIFPRTTSGKIQRNALRKMFEEGTFNQVIRDLDIRMGKQDKLIPGWFYEKVWMRSNIEPAVFFIPRCILVLSQDNSWEQSFSKQYPDAVIIYVTSGAAFARTGYTQLSLNFADIAGYAQLAAALQQDALFPDVIIDAWHAGAADQAAQAGNAHQACWQMAALWKALSAQNVLPAVYMLLTAQAQQVLAHDEPVIDRAALHGLMMSLQQEHPDIIFKHTDIDAGATELPHIVHRELSCSKQAGSIAYRNGHRWELRITMHQNAAATPPLQLKTNGCYLLTGGLGVLGTQLCSLLLQQYQARLIITGSTAAAVVLHGADHERAANYRMLEQLALDSGGAVTYCQPSITDAAAIQDVIAGITANWNCSLDGIFHLAGIAGNSWQPVAELDDPQKSFAAVFHAKVAGAQALMTLLRQHTAAFMVAYSSVNAVFGATGAAPYAAACCAMDHVLLKGAAKGLSTQSINWSMWKGAGMGEEAHMQHAARAKGYCIITPAQAMHSLLACLQSGSRQLLVGLDGANPLIGSRRADLSYKRSLKVICAATAAPSLQQVITDTITRHLKAMPFSVIILPELPLLTDGTPDYNALLQVSANGRLQNRRRRPESGMEQQVAAIWEEVLQCTVTHAADNFFELRGDSLKAVQVIALIYKKLQLNVAMSELFNHPTVEKLAALLSGAAGESYNRIEPAPLAADYPLSHAQQRLWIQEQYDGSSAINNIAGVYRISGELAVPALEKALQALIARHEVLRTRLVLVNNEPRQQVIALGDFELPYVYTDISAHAEPDLAAAGLASLDAAQSFDLLRGPLLRVRLLKLTAQQYVFLFNLHHIIADGMSIPILMQDLQQLYRVQVNVPAGSLPVLDIQYKDYALWHHTLLQSADMQQHRSYWMSVFSNMPERMDFPLDHARPAAQSYKGHTIYFRWAPETCDALTTLGQQHNATLYMVLLSIFKLLLFRYTGQYDITVGTTVGGREHPELKHQAGMYINTLALLSRLHPEDTFTTLLQQVRTHVLEALEHQLYPFDQLITDLQLERLPDRSALFDIGFSLNTWMDTDNLLLQENVEISVLKENDPLAAAMGRLKTARHDIWLYATRMNDELLFALEYNADIFREESMQLLVKELETLAARVLQDSNKQLAAYPLSENAAVAADDFEFNF